ncbi:hypothetical protein FAF40_01330 [Staphylococcus haemolyticus]|uniref:hypothetical protein n=1 Tax=Staphylococcus haemolyticus TaxID=1283 RepID=UPI0010AC3ED0|nr:hypothetical protein [Staphylococcus haemolyticus]MCH4441756.1 hypothetical protein [Staphylococcus haemolyticus]TJX73988.1 hypothetical protein FAF40_01330 [Staphylococcus haemolyticus]HDF1966574.1 hypothetical protein [Staphylococcus aureus]HDM8576052.1 hypothetical protein [Staphylococcus aureus]
MYMVFVTIAIILMWYAVHRIVYKRGNKTFNYIYFVVTAAIMYVVAYNGMQMLNTLHQSMN